MKPYPPLNLPPCPLRIELRKGRRYVFDLLRRKYVALTSEEWVRQHFVHYLLSQKNVPAELTANEDAITLNTLARRCDTVVYDRQLQPLAIIEYKAPAVPISANVFNQAARYNMVLGVPYLIISNGIHHFCCQKNNSRGEYTSIDYIPTYSEMLLALNHLNE